MFVAARRALRLKHDYAASPRPRASLMLYVIASVTLFADGAAAAFCVTRRRAAMTREFMAVCYARDAMAQPRAVLFLLAAAMRTLLRRARRVTLPLAAR